MVRIRVIIRVSLVYLVCASTLDNNVAPSAESVFVQTENSEIQRLISIHDFLSVNSELLQLISIRKIGNYYS